MLSLGTALAQSSLLGQDSILGQGSTANQGARTQAHLLLAADSARAGDTMLAGVELHMPPGWHTYWKNSGASGLPTSIKWDLPAGVTAGDIQWPVPEKLPDADLTTYIYTGATSSCWFPLNSRRICRLVRSR